MVEFVAEVGALFDHPGPAHREPLPRASIEVADASQLQWVPTAIRVQSCSGRDLECIRTVGEVADKLPATVGQLGATATRPGGTVQIDHDAVSRAVEGPMGV